MAKPFDLFLSHNSVDRPWVARLKSALEARGLTVWLDRDEIRPGDLFVHALEQGLNESKAVALVISPESVRSGWVREEYSRALALAQDRHEPVQLIPVLLRDAELPGFLANRSWVDFREEDRFEQALEQLIWGATGKNPRDRSARPLKRRALLDRRLAAELIVSYRPDGTRRVDPLGWFSSLYALSVFENILIEDQFGSILAALVQREELLEKSVLFVRPEIQPGFLQSVAELSRRWLDDPGFQVAASVYGRSKGNTTEGCREVLSYLERTLLLARAFDAAIVPHPDRWRLYEHLFERCDRPPASGEGTRAILKLPEPADAAALAVSEQRSAQVEQLSSAAPGPVLPGRLVQYGPTGYPVPPGGGGHPKGLLESFPAFVYEFCLAGPSGERR